MSTHRGILFLFDHAPFRVPPHVFEDGPFSSNPSEHDKVQLVPYGDF